MKKSATLPITIRMTLDADAIYDTLCASGIEIDSYDYEEVEIMVKAKAHGTVETDDSVGYFEQNFDYDKAYIEKELGKYFDVSIREEDIEHEE